MQQNEVEKTLGAVFPIEIVQAMIKNYIRAVGEYHKENWQYFGNEMGQFIECTRRLIEYKVNDKYTKLEDKLPNFNEKVLTQWENASSFISEEYRIIIPRVLFSMYCIRNKRGMIHKNNIDPNHMDSTLLINNGKWILSELVRLSSTLSFDETTKLVESIMNREISIIWNTGTVTRILNTKMCCADQVVCLLYIKNDQTEQELRDSIEYANITQFRNILKKLHKNRIIEYCGMLCSITPLGIQKAESILKS